MRYLIPLLLILPGCDSKQASEEPSTEPKTYYGQSVEKSRDLDAASDARNEEMEQQAADLFDEQ